MNGGGRHEHTGPQIICRACRGTGAQLKAIGKTAAEERFAKRLLREMEVQMSNAEVGIRRNRAVVDEAKRIVDDGKHG